MRDYLPYGKLLAAVGVLFFSLLSMRAQSLNTASMVIVVLDQNGAAMNDAEISILNPATGEMRKAVSEDNGSATIPALAINGTYSVEVSKPGFAVEKREGVVLRSGETATLIVKLLIGSSTAEVIVYGTAEGVRTDPQSGDRFDSAQLNEIPVLGRKLTSVPLLNSAFRQGKGLGDIYMNRLTRWPALARAARLP